MRTDDSIFLNGACDIFAQALHETYGYAIYHLVNRAGRLLHAFCMDKDGRYVDFHGKMDDAGFLNEYIGNRKCHRIELCEDYSLEPYQYSDIYTEHNFREARRIAHNRMYA